MNNTTEVDAFAGVEFPAEDKSVFISSSARSNDVVTVEVTDEQVEAIRHMTGDEVMARANLAQDKFQGPHISTRNFYRLRGRISEEQKTTMSAFLMSHPHTLNGVYDKDTHEIMSQEQVEAIAAEQQAHAEESAA